jgi:hypothetical protein
MDRRGFILGGVGALVFYWAKGARAEGAMITVNAEHWKFQLPSDWHSVQTELRIPYLESGDGAKGCYVKEIAFREAYQSSREAANYLQRVHEQGFKNDPQAKWKVVDRSGVTVGSIFKSRLDMFDRDKSYRILSCVYANPRMAFQLTLHDYACERYVDSVRYFALIEDSIEGTDSASTQRG